jgi:ketosteroid isomerase-like protein
MAQQNVEAVRRVYERWARGDFTASMDLLDAQAVLVIGSDFPDAGTYEGLEGIREYMRGFLEPWTRVTIAAEELTDAGDAVLAAVHQSGTGESSGVETELRYFQVWTFRDGKVGRLEGFRDRARALEAAGLRGQ